MFDYVKGGDVKFIPVDDSGYANTRELIDKMRGYTMRRLGDNIFIETLGDEFITYRVDKNKCESEYFVNESYVLKSHYYISSLPNDPRVLTISYI